MREQVVAIPGVLEGRSVDDPADRLAALFDAHQARLFRLARRLARAPEDPADLVQETFLRAARDPHRVPWGAPNEEAWLVRVLINICRDAWRHRSVHAKAVAEHRLDPADVVEPEPGMLAHAMVWRALDRLHARRRAILIMCELEGASIPAIARLLGVTPVTVRWHLMMARREMARTLGDGQ